MNELQGLFINRAKVIYEETNRDVWHVYTDFKKLIPLFATPEFGYAELHLELIKALDL